jgi:hypothetical protein
MKVCAEHEFFEESSLIRGLIEIPEARAILLGRIGKHDEALRIYVYRLKDYAAAERWVGTLLMTGNLTCL